MPLLASAGMSSVLIIGFDPHAVPGIDGDAMRAVLDQELARFSQHGIDASMLLVTLDDTTEAAITAALAGREWDVVVIGGGVAKRTLSSPSLNRSSAWSASMRRRRRSHSIPVGPTASRLPSAGCDPGYAQPRHCSAKAPVIVDRSPRKREGSRVSRSRCLVVETAIRLPRAPAPGQRPGQRADGGIACIFPPLSRGNCTR